MEKQEEIDRLVETLEDVMKQSSGWRDGTLDSAGSLSYTAGIKLLAEYGKVDIVSEEYEHKRVIAKWREG